MRAWPVLLLALLLCLLAPRPAQAEAGVVGHRLATCVARVETAAYRCDRPQQQLGPGDFLVHAAVPRGIDPAATRLRFAGLWQRALTIRARYADGVVATVWLDGQALTRRLQLGAIIEQPLPRRVAPLTDVTWRVEGASNLRGIIVGATLATPDESAGANLLMAVLYAGFLGLVLGLLFYNLALWSALRHRFQLAYCVMLVALGFYAITSSGAVAWLWPDMVNTDRLRLNYLTLAISAAAAVEFARSFFPRRVFAGWFGHAATGLQVYLLAAAALFALLAPWHIAVLDLVFAGAFVSLLGLVPPLVWRTWRVRGNHLRLFALAWTAPIVVATLRTAGNFHLVPWSFWLDHSTIVSMAMEALVSGLAITYRIRLLSRERDAAREKEIAARLLADSDPLTGLMNRRGFLREALGRAGTQRLLIADIDHFKRVNDTLGHDGGDEVLRLVARALRAAAPPDALVARLGGEEFAILGNPATAPSPAALLDRVREERMPFDLAVTISVGACAGPLITDPDWKALYRAADRALFDAKAAGRDRARHSASIAA